MEKEESYEKRSVLHVADYNVGGPNHLWHLDGYHKLIKWGFVIHGCIDGFSRSIVFLRCSNNNLSSTVLKNFGDAVANFGCPSRTRCDYGGENVLVADFMICARGSYRGSILTGSSTRNQRIERLWLDVSERAVWQYRVYFWYLEEQDFIDQDDEIDRFIIQYLFMDRINKDIDIFSNSWNNHKISM